MQKRVFALALPLLVILSLSAQAAESRVIQVRPELYCNAATAISETLPDNIVSDLKYGFVNLDETDEVGGPHWHLQI